MIPKICLIYGDGSKHFIPLESGMTFYTENRNLRVPVRDTDMDVLVPMGRGISFQLFYGEE